jgi:hypothetical protein
MSVLKSPWGAATASECRGHLQQGENSRSLDLDHYLTLPANWDGLGPSGRRSDTLCVALANVHAGVVQHDVLVVLA